MKKLTVFLKPLFFAGAIALGLTSCQKEGAVDLGDLTGSENAALAEQHTDDLSNIIDDANNSSGNSLSGYRISGESEEAIVLSECATITRDTISNPHVITVDFGPVNCLCRDGRYRRGKIIATFTGPYRAEGTVISHTTEDYYVNDNQIDATKTVTNLGRNGRGNLHYAIVVNSTITLANGEGIIIHEAHRDREWILGEMTPERTDDVYLIRGTGHSTAANGVEYHSEILSPLRKEIGFRFIVAGIERVVRVAEETRVATMDFGYPHGERDDLGLVTFGNGRTRVVHLR
jgi:hypothetical protein